MRCVQPEPQNDGGMGTATAAESVSGPDKAVLIAGALAAAGVSVGIAASGGGDDSPGG